MGSVRVRGRGRWMPQWLYQLWHRVHEPRFVAVLMFLGYLILAAGGIYALINPPGSIEGYIGELSMTLLAALLSFGGAVGAVGVLPGKFWIERVGLIAIAAAAVIYGTIVTILHYTSPSGNRLLQLAFILFALITLIIRGFRIRERPYDPNRPPPTTVSDVAPPPPPVPPAMTTSESG